MNTVFLVERRCRYRLSKHGMKMHKKGNTRNGYYYAVYGKNDSVRDIPDEAYQKLDSVVEYCVKLELREREYRDRHKC